MATKNFDLKIRTAVDLQGVKQLKASLQEIQTMVNTPDNKLTGSFYSTEIQKSVSAAQALDRALEAAFDVNLNSINLNKFNQELKRSNLNVNSLYKDLSRLGSSGQAAFMNMMQANLTMGNSIQKTNQFVNEMKNTFANTIRWGISSGLWNTMLSSVSKAFTYVKGLNADLNDIRIVTGKSADQMERFAKQANKAAKDLAVSTRDYTQGALIYYQQGLSDEEVAARTNVTAKASNVTGQDMSTVSEQLTAVWNGYQVANEAAKEGMQVYEEYVDKMTAVASTTASDLEEQATAMSKVASAAYSMGLEFDELNAQISTIVSVTRQAPESVGTALKTIYARLGDLQVDGIDEFGTSLGDVSSQLQVMGVEVLDSNGQMREMGDVMTEVALKWDTWTSAQKQAAAVAMAGKRQYNNLIALFDNWDMYGESLKTSMEATGTLSEQQTIALDSLENKMEKLQATAEKFYDALFNEESLGGIIDALTGIVDMIGSLTKGLGGLKTILPAIGGLLLRTFKADIGRSLAANIINRSNRLNEIKNDQAKQQVAYELRQVGVKGDSKQPVFNREIEANAKIYQEMSTYKQQMNTEDLETLQLMQQQRYEATKLRLEQQEEGEGLKNKNKLIKEYLETYEKIEKTEYNLAKQIDNNKDKDGNKLTKVEKQKAINQKQMLQTEKSNATKNLHGYGIASMSIGKFLQDEMFDVERKKYKDFYQKIFNEEYNSDKGDLKQLVQQKMNEIQQENEQLKTETGQEKVIKQNEKLINSFNQLEQEAEEAWNAVFSIDAPDNELQVAQRVIAQQMVDEELEQRKQASKKKKGTTVGVGRRKNISTILKDEEKQNEYNIRVEEELKRRAIERKVNARNHYMDKMKEQDPEMTGEQAQKYLEIYDKARERFVQLKNEGKDVTTALEQVAEEFSDSGLDAEQFANKMKEAEDAIRHADARLEQFEKQMDLQAMISNISQLVGGISSVGSSIMGIIGAIETAGDSSLEQGERLKSSIMGLLTALGFLPSTILSIKNSFTALSTQLANSTLGMKLFKVAADDASAAGKRMAKSNAILLAITLILAAAITAVTATISSIAQEYSDATAKANSFLQENKLLTEELKEEKEAIDSINSELETLNEQYLDQKLSLDELRSSVADICLEYENQDLAMKVLASDYKNLNTLIKENQDLINADYIESLEKEQKSRVSTIAAKLEENAKSWMRDDNGLDVVAGGTSKDAADAGEQQLIDSLEGLGITIDDTGHMKTKDFAQALATDYDAVMEILDRSSGKVARLLRELAANIFDDAQEYKEAQNNLINTKKERVAYKNTSNINNAEDYLTALSNMQEEASFIKDDAERLEWAQTELLKSLKEEGNEAYAVVGELARTFNISVDEIEDKIKDFNNSEKNILYLHIQYADDSMTLDDFIEGYDGLVRFLSNRELETKTEGILGKDNLTELTKEDIENIFQNTNFEELSGVTQEEFELLNFEDQTYLLTKIYTLAGDLSEKYKQDAIQDQQAIVDKLTEELELLEQTKAAQEQEQKDAKKAFFDEEAYKNYSPKDDIQTGYYGKDGQLIQIDSRNASLDEILQNELGGYSLDEYAKLAQKATTEGIENMTADELEVYRYYTNHLSSIGGLTNDILDFYAREEFKDILDTTYYDKEIEETSNLLNEATEQLSNYMSYEQDYGKQIEQQQKQRDKYIDSLHKLTDTYDTLENAINDYNENGYITEDTLTSLLALSPQELQYLEFKNGALTINNQLMEEQYVATIRNAQATLLMEYQSTLAAIAQGDLSAASIYSSKAFEEEASSILAASDAAHKGTTEFLNFGTTLANLSGYQINLHSEEMLAVAEAVQKKFLFLEDMANNHSFGKTVDEDDLKLLDEEIDRYWEINHALGEIEQAMKDVKRIQDKLHGKELITSLKQENELLEEQSDKYKKLLEEQKTEAAELQTSLQSLGVDFYEDGGIANYKEAMTNAINAYNAVMGNSGASDSAKEAMEEKYEKFVEELERYDQLFYEDIEETLNNIDENRLAELENNLKVWEIEIELNLDKKQLERDLNDFVAEIGKDLKLEFEDLKSVMDNLFENSKTYGLSDDKTIGANVIAMQETMAEIDKLMAGEESTMFASVSEAQEKLKELFETTQDETLDLKDLYADMWDTYMEGIDQSAEKFENIIEQYDVLAEELEYQKELIELIHGEEAYSEIEKIYKAQKINTLSQIESLKQQVDVWTQFYNAADKNSADKAKYLELMNEAQSSLNEKLTEYVQILKDDYINTINKILQGFQKDITGSSLDEVSQQWDKIKEKSDKYFDSVESLYEIQSFANNIQMSIDETTTLKNQQKLQALYDREIEYLREKENLTQYDLDAAEARYQIALKEIALEEAQNAKNSMKLTRGADGNWSYQYVADQDDILAKQQDLAASYNDLYQLANSAYEENLDSLIQLQADYEESAMAIANNDLLNEKQKQIKFEELKREYLEKYKLLAQENTLYRNDLNLASSALLFNLYNQDLENYNNMTEAEKELTESLKNSNIEDFQELQDKVAENYDNIQDKANIVMTETLDAWTTNAQTMADKWNIDKGESVTAIVITATENMQTAWNNYQSSITEGTETAGKDIAKLGDEYSNVTGQVNGLKDATLVLVNETTSALEGYQSTIQAVGTQWDNVKGQVEGALKEAKKYFDYVGTYKGEDINFDHGEITTGNKDGWDTGGDLYGGGGSNTSSSAGKGISVYAGTSMSSKIADSIDPSTLQASKYATDTKQEGKFYKVMGDKGLQGYVTEQDYFDYFESKENKLIRENPYLISTQYLGSSGYRFEFDNGQIMIASLRDNGDNLDTLENFKQFRGLKSVLTSDDITNKNGGKKVKLEYFSSGGYTGDWGSSDGRLAVLHQKELVLNSKDTENILNTVQAVRNIESGIMNKINSMILGLSNLTQTSYIPAIAGGSSTTDNVFNITAEFPNANDVTSIREAILSLPNIASQYIAENKK